MSTIGNLGNYQRLVQLAKAADGPVKLGIYVVAGGLLVGTAIGTAVGPAIKRRASEAFHAVNLKLRVPRAEAGPLFTVNTEVDACEVGMGLTFYAGDQFRVLQSDGDAIMIEVIGNAGNPFVASGKLLQSISDFRIETED